jgi:hypothetical protein
MRTRLVPQFTLLAAALLAAAACGPKKASARGENAVQVTDISMGRSLAAGVKIDDQTTTFKPADAIYTVVETKGNGTATVAARWTYQDNQVVNESSKNIQLAGDEPVRTEFHISKPDGWPAGKYHVDIMLNGTKAGEKDFEVK